MKVLKWFLVLLLSLTLFGCADILPKGDDGETVYVEVPEDSEDPITEVPVVDEPAKEPIVDDTPIETPIADEPEVIPSYTLAGTFQKGKCDGNGQVLIWPLVNGTLGQTGDHFIGLTAPDGSYTIPAEMTEEYVFVYFKGYCDDEANGGNGYQELYGYRKASDPIGNMNVLTKISKPVADWLIKDEQSFTFGKVKESIEEAERLTLIYMSVAGNDIKFSEMSLENQTGDILALASSVVLYGRTDVESADYMSLISAGIMDNDLTLKDQIQADYIDLPVVQIKSNLETSYASINKMIDTPKFWRLKHPAYFADLLERDPVAVSIDNLTDNTSCSFDQSTYNLFATPVTFDSGILSARFIALNFPKDAQVSVWTVGVDGNGNPAPGTELLKITSLKEIILDDPVKLTYNGMLGDDHGLVPDTQYYFRIRKDTDFTLSKGCEGDRLTTAYTLASDDEGLTYIGDKNEADRFFYFSGIKMYLTN